MSEIKLNPMFLRAKRSLGDIVFYEKNGKTFTRVKGEKSTPPSDAELDVRRAFSALAATWGNLSGIMRSSWNAWASKRKMNGYNAFIRENFSDERDGNAIDLFKPSGSIAIPEFSAAPAGPGEILCSYTVPHETAGLYIHFFVKKRTGGVSEGEIRRFSAEAGDLHEYRVTSLQPGSEYYVYAVFTDREYNAATSVSASAAQIASAGS